MGKLDEKILVVDRDYLFSNEKYAFQGITNDPEKVTHIRRALQSFYEAPRYYAETNNKMKQPIPYVIIRRGDEVFLYKRLKDSGESRLHDSLSIGVGGHMNLLNDNCRWAPNLKANVLRELNEELHIGQGYSEVDPKIIGFLNDDSNEVGQVHICILMELLLPEDALVSVKETDKLEGYFIRIQDLKKDPIFQSLENWSKMAVEILQ